jgi:hypothetical protein
MVPQVARAVLEQACQVHPEISRVADPFAGSGTILTESMNRGLNFCGRDINPLAVLLCRVKSGPFFVESLTEKSTKLMSRIDADASSKVDVDFVNIDKWFRSDVQIALSRIRRAILREGSLWARRFFWISLAEAIRFTSNSRTTTFKLHIRPKEEVGAPSYDAVAVFKKATERNLRHFEDQADHLKKAGYLDNGRYHRSVDITLGDTRDTGTPGLSDIILTSPPYGDNVTTVPYGQFSYLMLRWIDLADIDSKADIDCLQSTHEIDSESLGGSRRIKKTDSDHLLAKSSSLARYLRLLKDEPPDRTSRVTAFFRDLEACLVPILQSLRPSGLMVWTLGNRRVGDRRVPMDAILSELLAAHRASLLCKLIRRISSKRMAPKNNIANTISSESILVMRKASK